MDTGPGISAAYNAELLGIDLSAIDDIVLSHGHADHTGGLREILKKCKGASVICHPDLWSAKHVGFGPDNYRSISAPFSRDELEASVTRLIISREPVSITEHITTTGEIQMVTDYEQIDGNLFIKDQGSMAPDALADDLALVINADFGLVVILGCAHRGMINTLRQAQKITGKNNVHAVIGGTHLIFANEERIERTIADLKEIGIKKLGVSHCTGFGASARLAQEFPGIFFLNNAGTRLTLS
jgi:7,8-dihydropterin-6-yl-methyl-4-(beta-D-ribofuranosyl)aminobenzene 5'-phosphate synthase